MQRAVDRLPCLSEDELLKIASVELKCNARSDAKKYADKAQSQMYYSYEYEDLIKFWTSFGDLKKVEEAKTLARAASSREEVARSR